MYPNKLALCALLWSAFGCTQTAAPSLEVLETSAAPATALSAVTGGDPAGSCIPRATLDTGCDGIDDDCDGATDEDFMPAASSCGAGACARFGSTSCVAGKLQDSCVAGQPAAADATCDGVDEDCDGKLDDDFVPTTTRCGVGACSAVGQQSCVGGHLLDSCTPRTAAQSDATCDGVDDDCDGTTDDDYLSRITHCGVGACSRSGAVACILGHELDTCAAGAPAASDASCDGIDDDCNGVPDDGYEVKATRCGAGACAASGVQSCLNGQVVDSCLPLAAARCNAVDAACSADGCASSTTSGGDARVTASRPAT